MKEQIVEWHTPAEVMAMLGVTRRTVMILVGRGVLTGTSVADARVLVTSTSIARFKRSMVANSVGTTQ